MKEEMETIKLRSGNQLARENYLLLNKSKAQILNILLNTEEKMEDLQSQLKAKEEAEKEFKKLLEDKWNESQDIWFIKLLNKYEEITSKQAKENDEILSKGENK